MTEQEIFDDLQPLIKEKGLSLVDFRLQALKTGLHCQIILYSSTGLGTTECAQVHRLILPRLEVILESQDISLEVSSPGLSRVIRLPREYPIFLGRGLSVYLKDGRSLGGLIKSCNDESLILKSPKQEYELNFDQIQKAKLDETQEVT